MRSYACVTGRETQVTHKLVQGAGIDYSVQGSLIKPDRLNLLLCQSAANLLLEAAGLALQGIAVGANGNAFVTHSAKAALSAVKACRPKPNHAKHQKTNNDPYCEFACA